MGFRITQSYVINTRIYDYAGSPESDFSDIVNLTFKDLINSNMWDRVLGTTNCFYAVKTNIFTEDWFFIVVTHIGEYDVAKLATKITIMKRAHTWIHQDQNTGMPDAIYRGKRKVVSITDFVSLLT